MPLPVLEAIRNDLVDYKGRGLSVLEMSHRSEDFAEIAHRAESDLRKLLSIPDNYSVLFMQGGASTQFALTVQNLDTSRHIQFANTGYWSRKAMAVAAQSSRITEVIHCVQHPTIHIPGNAISSENTEASYLHITENETIDGIAFASIPVTDLPLVADMSSSILSKPIDIARYGLIYAGAQKNIGPAGITLVIIRDDLLGRSANTTNLAPMFSYAEMAKASSMLNTPPTFAWYTAGLVFQWLLKEGGLPAIAERNKRQADLVYQAIDQHDCYANTVHPLNRSMMNIPFQVRGKDTTQFLSGAGEQGLIGLKGHKSIGGLRASLYNAISDESVNRLVEYLNDFAEH